MYQKEMVNNFSRENIAKLTFGDLNTEIASFGIPTAEVTLAFTPTTLSVLESSFAAFNETAPTDSRRMENESSSVRNWDNSTQYSGLSDYSDSENSNSNDWMAGGKRLRTGDGFGASTELASDGKPARRLPGPRPSCRDEEMTPEELERRRRRRERNKMAAAKCRQRRVDQTNDLLIETKNLEDESQKLEKEIETLERLKRQLEFVLDAHKPMCKADGLLENSANMKVDAKELGSGSQTIRPTYLPITTTAAPSTSGSVSTSTNQLFLFDFPSTGLTPLGDPMTFFGSSDASSPSGVFLLSPSSLLAQ